MKNVTFDNENLVKDLVKSHSEIDRNGRLLFAGWYNIENKRGDVNLIEIFENFPDSGTGDIDTFTFPPSAKFPIKGKFKITITSPAELNEAKRKDNPIIRRIRNSKKYKKLITDPAVDNLIWNS